MQKNNTQISGFSFEKRAASPEKKFKKKKNYFQLICTDKIFKTVCRIF